MQKEKLEQVVAKATELYEDRKQRAKLVRFLPKKKLAFFNDARLYKLKGKALRRFAGVRPKDRPSALREALRLFTHALELAPNDASIYRERGLAWSRIRDRKADPWQSALRDLELAIRLDPKDPKSYLARAAVWRGHRRLQEAKRDLATAIRLDPKNPRAFRQRSWLWRRLGNHARAIKDYTAALRLDPEATAEDYVSLGDLYYQAKQYSPAFEQYNRAMDMDPGVDLWEVDYALLNIFSALSSLEDGPKRKIYEACLPISALLNEIRDLTDPSTDVDSPVVHFTKLSVADILISSDENKFRFYHVSYMNDPEEGKILLQILNHPEIERSYDAGSRTEESNFYLGSFLPVTHVDELVMWRTYGKDENDSEARGCSITIDRDFFGPDLQSGQHEPAAQESAPADRKKEPRTRYDTTLRRVVYYNKNERKIVGRDDGADVMSALRKLRTRLVNLIDRFKELDQKNSAINAAIDGVVYSIITELRYYFKSSDYAYENEERVILFVPPKSSLVKIEEGSSLPKRLYVEARNPIRKHIKRVVLGPRVLHPERWSYLKVKMIKDRNDLELVKSSCKFQ